MISVINGYDIYHTTILKNLTGTTIAIIVFKRSSNNCSVQYDNMTFDNRFKLDSDFLGEEDGSEIISVIADSDFEDDNSGEYPENLPLLPLRNTVLFPGVVFPVTVGRDKSIKLIQDAYKGDKIIGVVAQKDQKIEDPTW